MSGEDGQIGLNGTSERLKLRKTLHLADSIGCGNRFQENPPPGTNTSITSLPALRRKFQYLVVGNEELRLRLGSDCGAIRTSQILSTISLRCRRPHSPARPLVFRFVLGRLLVQR